MKTIIIPTDFSDDSIIAMNYGLDMAIATQSTVRLFYVYSVPVAVGDVPVMLVSVEELETNAERQMANLRKKVEHVTSGQIAIETETRLGDIVDELENLCDRIQPFAVVMGTKGSSGMTTLFGTTTMAAIRRLRWPVIAVPPGKEFGQGIKKIGFACDFRDVADTTPAGVIKDFARQFNAQLHVLNVSNSDHPTGKDTREFELLKAMLAEQNPVFDFIEHADVEDGINEFAEKNNLNLIITIPKKHRLLEGLFKKGSTRQLVLHSHIPVMCIHED